MNLNIKTIAVLLLSHVVVGLLVFMLTSAYYEDQAIRSEMAASTATARPQPGPSAGQQLDSLKDHPKIDLSDDPAEVDRQANEAFQSGDYAKAALFYQRVIELAPMKVEPHNNLGLTLHYLGRSDEALEVLKRGAQIQPQFQRIWLTLGFVQSSVGSEEEARQALQRAVDLGEDTDAGLSAAEMLKKIP